MEQTRTDFVLAIKRAFEVLGADQAREIFQKLYAVEMYKEKEAV